MIRRYKLDLDATNPAELQADELECSEQKTARLILNCKGLDSEKLRNMPSVKSETDFMLKSEEDDSESMGVSDTTLSCSASNSSLKSEPKKSNTSSKNNSQSEDPLSMNLENSEAITSFDKLSQTKSAKQNGKRYENENPQAPIWTPCFGQGQQAAQTKEFYDILSTDSFDLLTEQFKRMPSVTEPSNESDIKMETEQCSNNFAKCSYVGETQLPSLRKRASSLLFGEPFYQSNPNTLLSTSLANVDVFQRRNSLIFEPNKMHQFRDPSKLDPFSTTSTDFTTNSEVLDHNSKNLLPPSFLFRNMSLDQSLLPPLSCQEQIEFESFLPNTHFQRSESSISGMNPYFFMGENFKNDDTLCQSMTLDKAGDIQVPLKSNSVWPFKIEDSENTDAYQIPFSRNVSEFPFSLNEKLI